MRRLVRCAVGGPRRPAPAVVVAAASFHACALWRSSIDSTNGEIPAAAPPGLDTAPNGATDENKKWWPVDTKWSGRVKHDIFSSAKPQFDGMLVPEVKRVPDPQNPEQLTVESDSFFSAPHMYMMDPHPAEKQWLPPASFDPALDDIEDQDFQDAKLSRDVLEAAESDKKRLEAFGNPLTVEDQLDYLLGPQREGQEVQQQRQEFNGFLHWGLLYAANVAIDQEQDAKKAHQYINRYMRDIDLFGQWLKHPKVVAHMQKKFNFDLKDKFDKLLSMAISLFIRSKVQCFEGDHTGALKSLVGAAGLINEGGKLEDFRHRKILGAVLSCRGMVYSQLKSWERAEDDLTRSLAFLPKDRAATIYQLRAEAREALGRLDEAREDEERAADIWENAEVIHPGLDHPPVKWVL